MVNERRGLLLCATTLWISAAMAAEPTAEEILSGAAAPIDYSRAVKCIAWHKIERAELLNDRYIVFHLSGDELWLAQLRMKCPGVTPSSVLSFEKDTNQLCEWDSVRTVTEDGIDGVRLGPKCNLPKFEPVSPEQVAMLKQHIRNPGHPPTEAKP